MKKNSFKRFCVSKGTYVVIVLLFVASMVLYLILTNGGDESFGSTSTGKLMSNIFLIMASITGTNLLTSLIIEEKAEIHYGISSCIKMF